MRNVRMRSLPHRSAGGGRPQKGRDLHGTAVIPKLVAFLVLPAEVRLVVCANKGVCGQCNVRVVHQGRLASSSGCRTTCSPVAHVCQHAPGT